MIHEQQNYKVLQLHMQQPEIYRDIFIAELAAIGYEGFEEKQNGVEAYVAAKDFDLAQVEALLERYKAISETSFTLIERAPENWNEVWESNFPVVEIDKQLLIHAPFHEVSKDFQYRIVMEPRMAFGTGHHETTFLMSKALLDIDCQDKTVLDFGCGTGVLAILAMMRGASTALAIDNDDLAAKSSRINASMNKVDVEVIHGDENSIPTRSFDLVLANINRNYILSNMEALAGALSSGGTILFSGFYQADKQDIAAAAKKYALVPLDEMEKNEWTVLVLRKGNT